MNIERKELIELCDKFLKNEIDKTELEFFASNAIMSDEIDWEENDKIISECYESHVDTRMRKKYGDNYNKIIEETADSILISKINLKNKVVDFDELDEQSQPKLKIGNNITSNIYVPVIKTKFNLKTDHINYSFLDLDFIIEKDGTVSNLNISNWVNGFKENEIYKKELFKIAKNIVMKEYSNWIAGNYKGNLVRVRKNFRISFK